MKPTDNLPGAEAAALEAAFNALASYDQGSSRAALLPIDHAAIAAGNAPELRQKLEQRLLSALCLNLSGIARDYVASRLAWIGGDASAAALASSALVPPSDTAFRTALEAIPGRAATQALLDLLPRSTGPQKLGIIASLGMKRDANTVRPLRTLLDDPDPDVVAAALSALGNNGSRAAARTLRNYSPPRDGIGKAYAEAVLCCADQLLAAGSKSGARNLYQLLIKPTYARHVQEAAQRGRQACA